MTGRPVSAEMQQMQDVVVFAHDLLRHIADAFPNTAPTAMQLNERGVGAEHVAVFLDLDAWHLQTVAEYLRLDGQLGTTGDGRYYYVAGRWRERRVFLRAPAYTEADFQADGDTVAAAQRTPIKVAA